MALQGFQSQLESTTIRALIVGIVSMLGAFGAKFVLSDAQVESITQGILAAITVGSMIVAWYGRVKATKKIAVTTTEKQIMREEKAVARQVIPFVLISLAMGVLCAGCAGTSPTQQVYGARQIYTGVVNSWTTLLKSGVVTDKEIVLAVRAARQEAGEALDEAEAKATAGDRVGFDFAMRRLNGYLDKLIMLVAAQEKKHAATQPVSYNGGSPWNWRRFSPSCKPSWASATPSLARLRLSIPVAS